MLRLRGVLRTPTSSRGGTFLCMDVPMHEQLSGAGLGEGVAALCGGCWGHSGACIMCDILGVQRCASV